MDIDDSTTSSVVSTGSLPQLGMVQALLEAARRRYADIDEGALADYIPALAHTPRRLFGLCIVGVNGDTSCVGDARCEFSIQSVSKPFVFALACEALGADAVRGKIGVNNSGLPFDSIMAVELNPERTMNAMVNAGAIATTSLAPGEDAPAKWRFVREGLSRFAGRKLELDEDVFESEVAVNQRNRGLAYLLESYGRLFCDAEMALEVYTRQCALKVSAVDLATMGATLADGGVNPVSGEPVVSGLVCKRVLAVLAAAGMYERSGEWLYDVGLPGKSGVSGGIVTIAPGKGRLATFSPLVDASGASVRGQLATRFLSERLGLNLFASTQATRGASA
ncbi:MAG TPA: glutaminase A [Steroidobacter sp.]|nr:glutaminase A [Steroidobacter sp.]